jgi:MoxR-like ATPase
VKALAYPALGHRLIASPAARAKGVIIEELVNECLERVPVPGVRAAKGSDS